MEQNNQPMENSAEIKLESESESIAPKPEKKVNKKIILLIIICHVLEPIFFSNGPYCKSNIWTVKFSVFNSRC